MTFREFEKVLPIGWTAYEEGPYWGARLGGSSLQVAGYTNYAPIVLASIIAADQTVIRQTHVAVRRTE